VDRNHSNGCPNKQAMATPLLKPRIPNSLQGVGPSHGLSLQEFSYKLQSNFRGTYKLVPALFQSLSGFESRVIGTMSHDGFSRISGRCRSLVNPRNDVNGIARLPANPLCNALRAAAVCSSGGSSSSVVSSCSSCSSFNSCITSVRKKRRSISSKNRAI